MVTLSLNFTKVWRKRNKNVSMFNENKKSETEVPHPCGSGKDRGTITEQNTQTGKGGKISQTQVGDRAPTVLTPTRLSLAQQMGKAIGSVNQVQLLNLTYDNLYINRKAYKMATTDGELLWPLKNRNPSRHMTR